MSEDGDASDDDDDLHVPGLPRRRRAPPVLDGETVAPARTSTLSRAIVASVAASTMVSVVTSWVVARTASRSSGAPVSHAIATSTAERGLDTSFRLPSLVHVPLENARAFLDTMHLTLRVREQRALAGTAPDTVLAQSPLAGTVVRRGDIVDVVLSAIPPPTATPPTVDASAPDAPPASEQVQVPRVLGMRAARAQTLLAPLGLRIGHRSETYDENRESSVILHQAPGADASVARGSAVDIVVNAAGPPGGEEH